MDQTEVLSLKCGTARRYRLDELAHHRTIYARENRPPSSLLALDMDCTFADKLAMASFTGLNLFWLHETRPILFIIVAMLYHHTLWSNRLTQTWDRGHVLRVTWVTIPHDRVSLISHTVLLQGTPDKVIKISLHSRMRIQDLDDINDKTYSWAVEKIWVAEVVDCGIKQNKFVCYDIVNCQSTHVRQMPKTLDQYVWKICRHLYLHQVWCRQLWCQWLSAPSYSSSDGSDQC